MACKKAFEEYTINGVKVKFPFKPYPSQFTMMDKIIKCIEKGQNSLLESPTGSGKSLALLCSSIAWLMAEKEKIIQQQREYRRSLIDQLTDDCIKEEQKPDVKVKIEQLNESKTDVKPHIKAESNPDGNIKIEKQDPDETVDQKPIIKTEANEAIIDGVQVKTDPACDVKPAIKNEATTENVLEENQEANDEQCLQGQITGANNDVCMQGVEDEDLADDVADFQAPKKRFRTPGGQIPRAKKRRQSDGEVKQNLVESPTLHPEWSMELHRTEGTSTDNSHSDSPRETEDHEGDRSLLEDELEIPPSPKIYFGTRTHKQIAQIVRELNKTEYKTTKMCILASRDHTCIHPFVSNAKNKTEECRKSVEKREGNSCSFYARARYVKHQEDLEDYGITKAWDLSELVELGERIEGCPYYMTREIVKGADIVFCPYNYLIDPLIRQQMDIKLANQIVILDEAHNIEDSCRDAAGWCVTPNNLDEAMKDLDFLISKNFRREQHQVLHEVAANLRRWIMAKAEYHSGCHDFSTGSKIWEGQDLKQALNSLAFSPAAVRQLTKHFNKAMEPMENSASRDKRERTNMHAATAKLFEGLFMVLSFIMKNDYKHLPDYRAGITKEYAMVPSVMPNGFRRTGEFEKKLVYTLNFWCLNPAVAFFEIGEYSRSVILTSGTLSPMSTFSSELGCKFPVQLEANHVIGSSQVWVSSLAVGPSGSTLNATYRFAETFDFQDEVGEAIHRVCETVPHGVLCFLPSYSMLDKLMKRWKMTGLWGRLNRLKNTFSEPRRGDKTDFDLLMSDFYDCIKLSEDSVDGESGALFLAVCRGKVSEGLDFADNNARAVITIGIPFPNVKNIQIDLKKKYNNQHCSSRGLLNGNEWYEIQGYRALNQALGRCIRHRNDWGAIVLIDERFGKSPRYRNGLSKWIRGKVVHHNNFPNLLSSLVKFTKARVENPCPNNTMLQTPGSSASPKQSIGSNETKCREESPISVKSSPHSSQTPSEKGNIDLCAIKQEHGLISTPTLNYPQTTPVAPPVSASNVSKLQQFAYTPSHQNMSTSGVNEGQSGAALPGIVRVKQEPQSPPGTQHELNSTSEVMRGSLQRDTLGNQNTLDSTPGVKQGSNRTRGVWRKPLFSVESSETLVAGDKPGGENDKAGSSTSLTRSNIPEPLNITGCGAGVRREEDTDDPDSPLLFCTPPTSFENSDGEGEDGVEGEKGGHTVNPVDTTLDRNAHKVVGITKDKHGSEGMEKRNGKDLLDIFDDTARENISNVVTWDVICKACDSTLCSTSDDRKPRDEEIVTTTTLGNILNSLLSKNRKKKTPSLATLYVPHATALPGCSSAVTCGKGKQTKQDPKLNSIYCEEQSRCYISLVCKNCKETRTSRSRADIVAVHALPCGTEKNQTESMVWFNCDKVTLLSSPE